MSATIEERAVPAIEIPTLLLVLGIHSFWLLLTWFHATLPWWLFLALAAWLSAWWGSAQHEILHGHPTRHDAFNTALALPPYWLWLPFARYRDTHLVHHRDERLTDPVDDPESRYWTATAWRELGPLGRAMMATQATLAGRMMLGPPWVIARFLWAEFGAIRAGDRALAAIWLRHALASMPVLIWAFGICDVPVWLYLIGFVHGGLMLTLIRSFAEHRALPDVRARTAIVENSRVLGLLFLFNNLHVVHHRWPSVPWYRLPRLYRAHRDAFIASNDGLVYDGYRDLFTRFLFRRHDDPVHPLHRSP